MSPAPMRRISRSMPANQISVAIGSQYAATDLFCIVTQSNIDTEGTQIPDNPGYDTLDAVRAGTDVIFMSYLNHHYTFKVTVLASHAYETWARWLLLILGLPLALRGIRLLRRNRLRRPSLASNRVTSPLALTIGVTGSGVTGLYESGDGGASAVPRPAPPRARREGHPHLRLAPTLFRLPWQVEGVGR
jgi:hypothetical protein